MKKLLCVLLACWASLWAEADIVGFWKSISEKTGLAQCVVAIYPYQGSYYGRMIGSFNDAGTVMDETLYNPKKRAAALPGQPYYCGMDFIWALDRRGSTYDGEILDPEQAKVYKASLWVEGGNLKVEGKLMFFGRTQTWVPAKPGDYPEGFKMPDVSAFVPVAPVSELTPQLGDMRFRH
ncbi:MAG TPA: DUF2147 domain-containing protein [Rhabdochlamydiaceae bacterium]|nr:DUF2147 domain-containing protein [Rhabdochlamydiaceae bacterium]